MANTRDPARFQPLELEAWSGLLSTFAILVREIDRRLQAEQGLSFREYDVLATLDMTDDRRLRMTALAERLVLSPSRTTRFVGGLEEKGWLERVTCDEDRRGQWAALTDRGLAVLRNARRTHHAAVRELFIDRLPERDLRHLARIWRALGTEDPALDEALASLAP